MPQVLTEWQKDPEVKALTKVYMKMGFEPMDSELLAIARVSPSEVRNLIDKGCPLHLVIEILL